MLSARPGVVRFGPVLGPVLGESTCSSAFLEAARHVISGLSGAALIDANDLPTVLLLENQGREGLVPRPIRLADGNPLVVGFEGSRLRGSIGTAMERSTYSSVPTSAAFSASAASTFAGDADLESRRREGMIAHELFTSTRR